MKPAVLLLTWALVAATALGEEFYHDFRTGPELPAELKLFGPDVELHVRSEAEGLRMTLPRDRRRVGPTGVETTMVVGGDFEVTLGFEILAIDAPALPYGSGLNLFLRARVVDGEENYILGRFRKPKGEVYSMAHGNTFFPPVATNDKRGKLRMARTQSLVRYLIASEGGAYQEIKTFTSAAGDVDLIRATANTGKEPIFLDLRVVDLRIRWDPTVERGPIPPMVVANAPIAAPEKAGPNRRWLAAVVATILLVSVGLFVALWMRRRKASQAAVPPARRGR